jgi:hypothetical protein
VVQSTTTADMKISATERMYETSLGVSDDMHDLFTAVYEPPVMAD